MQTPWRPGIKLRSAVAAVVVVALAFLVAGPVMVWYLHRSLLAEAELAAGLRIDQLKNELKTNGPRAVEGLLLTARGERSVAQLVVADRVVAASADLSDLPPMSNLTPAPGKRTTAVEQARDPGESVQYLVVAQGVKVGNQHYVLLVGESLASVNQSTRKLGVIFAAGLPALLVVVGVATYVIVARSLRPVESIRAQVALTSSRALSERIPVPEVRDEIGRLAVTMNDMLERLERAQIAQRRFVADASHELRSPLATLRSTLEIALVHPSTRTTSNTEAMLAETARLQGLVEGLVVLARSDERPHGVREDVDLEDLVQDERQRVRETTSLHVDGTLHPTRVLGNRQELAQVLRNLVDNATHHATGQMTLGVRSEQVDDVPVAVLSVGDDGPGIPPADRERVFERFVRLDPARSRNMGGSGLGLAIVRQLVNDHGGSVEVGVSSLGGALVEVRLPMPEEGQPPSGAMR